jgi:hypothetical protein
MKARKRKPAAGADRLPNGFAVAAETTRENSGTLLDFQALIMTRRFGVPHRMALALASLVFGEARQ